MTRLHFERRRARRRVTDIRVAVLKEARAADDRLEDPVADERRADRLIARAETLRDRENIGRYAVFLAREQIAGAAHARHHFVEDQQHAVLVADRANLAEVLAHRRHRARRRADDRFRDERRHRFRAEFENLRFELVGETLREGFVGFARALLAIRETGRDVMRFDQDRQERLATPCVAADRERAERVAVIALPPRDEMPPLRTRLSRRNTGARV